MLEIEKKEITIDYELRKRIETICKFNNVNPTIENGVIRKLGKTNIFYIEPHKIIIKNKLFLTFNNHEFIYLGNLENRLTFVELDKILNDLTKSY
jgi:hypothetical protein